MSEKFDFLAYLEPRPTPAAWKAFIAEDAQGNWLGNWEALAFSFRAAARVLLQVELSDRRETLIVPAAFVVRHYIELFLKGIWVRLRNAGLLSDDVPTNHNLQNLWGKIRKALIADWDTLKDDPDVREFGRTIALLHKFDGDATTFRYPVGTDGTEGLGKLGISIDELKNAFERADLLFSGIDGMMSACDC